MTRPLPPLGRLERAVLARLWTHGEADVAVMHRAVGAPREITRNTVQSALERLHRKGLADRRKVERAYVYRARVSQGEWALRALETLLRDLPPGGARVLLQTFVDLAERTGADELEELERLVRARRRREGGA